jgi:hypothetical protein
MSKSYVERNVSENTGTFLTAGLWKLQVGLSAVVSFCVITCLCVAFRLNLYVVRGKKPLLMAIGSIWPLLNFYAPLLEVMNVHYNTSRLQPPYGTQTCRIRFLYKKPHSLPLTLVSLKYNQLDATFSRPIYFYKLLYMFQEDPLPIIRSTKLYIQLQVLSNNIAACCYRGWDGCSIGWQYLKLYVQFCVPDGGRRNRLKHVQ